MFWNYIEVLKSKLCSVFIQTTTLGTYTPSFPRPASLLTLIAACQEPMSGMERAGRVLNVKAKT